MFCLYKHWFPSCIKVTFGLLYHSLLSIYSIYIDYSYLLFRPGYTCPTPSHWLLLWSPSRHRCGPEWEKEIHLFWSSHRMLYPSRTNQRTDLQKVTNPLWNLLAICLKSEIFSLGLRLMKAMLAETKLAWYACNIDGKLSRDKPLKRPWPCFIPRALVSMSHPILIHFFEKKS